MKNLFKALADFQQEVPVIHKGTQGYGYSYADLPAIFEIINPLLKKHGLGFYQAVNGGFLKTVVFHIESEELIESNTDIPSGVQLKGMNDFQVLGSAITYLRRYALSSLLGLVTDKDTDASGEQVKPAVQHQSQPQTQTLYLNPNTKEWQGAIEYLKGGGSIESITKKYRLSAENRQKLMDESV